METDVTCADATKILSDNGIDQIPVVNSDGLVGTYNLKTHTCMYTYRYQGCIQKFRLGGAIATEPPEKLSDHDLETILNVWNRKPHRISI